MCSKMSSGSYRKRQEDDDDDDYSGLYPKKQKHNNGEGRRRVPRRGPGVAELEKIRLEEQHISTTIPVPLLPREKLPATTKDITDPAYPFSSYLTSGFFPNDLIPPFPVFQRKHDSSLQYLPPMNLPNQGSGRFYQFIEPPSNQTSCLDNVTQILDKEKIMAGKRQSHFMAETAKCSVGPNLTIPRDVKSLDLRLKNHIQDSGTTFGNPITIDSPSLATPPRPNYQNSTLDFPRFLQKEDFDHEIMPQKSGMNTSSYTKPIYSFFPLNGQSIRDQDRSISLKTERYDTVTDHGIDLHLKL